MIFRCPLVPVSISKSIAKISPGGRARDAHGPRYQGLAVQAYSGTLAALPMNTRTREIFGLGKTRAHEKGRDRLTRAKGAIAIGPMAGGHPPGRPAGGRGPLGREVEAGGRDSEDRGADLSQWRTN